MGTHPAGDGVAWDSLEAVDIDQPQGLDYRYTQHLAKAVRKRSDKEHEDFADATVGGEHVAGWAKVLRRVDGTADVSGAVDSTLFQGGGLVWSEGKDTLWCITADVTTIDPTVMTLHPDRQYKGGDITWAGAHEFDASVDISGNVTIEGDLTLEGHLLLDSSADFSDVFVEGDASINGKLIIDSSADFSDVYIEGDVSIDGTTMLQNTVLTGDVTFTFDPIAGETGPIFKILGDWSSRSQDTTYTARTDGLVTANTGQGKIYAQTPAGTTRMGGFKDSGNNAVAMMLVKATNTWAMVADPTTATVTVYWLPFGDNT